MAPQRLERPRQGKVLAGVCAGISQHYGWNVTLVRIAFLLFGIFGAGEIVYLALWIIMPKAPR
jgi:phage shock protein C